MAVAGFVRTRKHQFGRQSSLNTPIAAKRVYAFKGVPEIDPQWTDPDVDLGSIDPVEAPYREAGDFTAPLTDPSLRYNTIPLLMEGVFGGNESSTPGADDAETWTHAPASLTADTTSLFTYEFGYTDVAGDWEQMYDGILESLEITGPVGLGALTTSMTWRFGGVLGSGFSDFPDSPAIPAAISYVQNEAVVYLKDASIFIASDWDNIDSGQVSDALHSFTLRVTKTVDQKRFANGTQSFDVSEYGTASRLIELECTWAKTSDIVGESSESDAWFSESSVDRFIKIEFISKVLASTGPDVPYSWTIAMPARYYTRTEGEEGGNATTVLTAHAYLDSGDFDGVFTSEAVTTLASASI